MAEPDGLFGRAKAIAGFINLVGVPVFLVVVMTAAAFATWAGYIESPIATRAQLDAHAENTQQLHSTLIGIGKQQVEVLIGIQKEFKAMRCERKETNRDKIECLGELSREREPDDPIRRRYRLPVD